MELPGQADIGSKVSIRLHINHQNSDQREDPIDALFTDILGTLETPTSIRKKNGELVTFDPTEIALWKVVPSTSQQTGIALYNTQTRRIDPLLAEIGKRVHIYCCGPTVYRDAHVGNLRTFLLPDLISRILRFDGWHPVVVQNITDVGHMNENFEDKLLEEATRERRNPIDIARDYEARFFTDLDRLNIAPADRSPRASESIPLMQEMISRLIENGVAYVGDDSSVYFSAETFESYGAISGNRLDSLNLGIATNTQTMAIRGFTQIGRCGKMPELEPTWSGIHHGVQDFQDGISNVRQCPWSTSTHEWIFILAELTFASPIMKMREPNPIR